MGAYKTALITGAATGIGKASALLFAKEGYCTAVHYNKSDKAAKTLCEKIAEEGGRAFAVQADLTKQNMARIMIDRVKEVFGHIDVLVNNAGAAQQKLFSDITKRDWDYILDVNLSSVFYCCQAALPDMISRRKGSIVNVSSVWGQAGASCEVHYSAAKAAVIGLTRALAKETGSCGVRVNCVAPGAIDTRMLSGLDDAAKSELAGQTPLCRLGTARDAAETIFFLSSEKADFITGQVISVNGGFYI